MQKIVENAILIYTDGSLYRKGLRGGYGIVFVHVDSVGEETILDRHAPPGIGGTTSNRMELEACIDALGKVGDLEQFGSVNRIVLRTDSQYVTKHYLNAFGSWARIKWRNMQGRPIENADLWKDFVRAYRKIRKPIAIEWVKGHAKGPAKDAYNVEADRLAKESAQSPLSRHVFRSSARRKISASQTRVGCVKMVGQTVEMRIIEVQWMKTQGVWKYRYEIMSRESADFGKVDLIFSSEHMRDGHTFEVEVNDNTKHPRVIKVIREIEKAGAATDSAPLS
jgi:ribonuclease HI